MLRIVDKRTNKDAMTFGDLKIGDCYQDSNENICIKVGEQKCMYFNDDAEEWEISFEDECEDVIPLEARLVIGGGITVHD